MGASKTPSLYHHLVAEGCRRFSWPKTSAPYPPSRPDAPRAANERNPRWSRWKRPWRTLPTWRPLNFVLQIFGTFAAEMVASDFQYGCLLQNLANELPAQPA